MFTMETSKQINSLMNSLPASGSSTSLIKTPTPTKESSTSLSSSASSLATDSSSLVDLKAEVFRKQQEAKFNKLHCPGSLKLKNPIKKQQREKDKIWSRKNAGLTAREKKDLEEDKAKEKQIQNALEEKAKMYDKLNSGEIEHDGRFLVNFSKNSNQRDVSSDEDDYNEGLYPEDRFEFAEDGENWVEYKDSLGRTRVAMKKDLPELKARDQDLKSAVRTQYDSYNPVTHAQVSSDPLPGASEKQEVSMLSEDMKRELLRQKWEKEEEENLKKTKLHYRDVLFDEARTHGAAFYNFSRNETERLSELENLEDMHKETEKARDVRNQVNSKRKTALEIRLKKVRDRKRLKMGLPIIEDASTCRAEEEQEIGEIREKSMEDSVLESLRKLREEQETQKIQKYSQRKPTVREWDLGKEGVDDIHYKNKLNTKFGINVPFGQGPMEKPLLSQKEWDDNKRRQRSHDFAPPSSYDKPGKIEQGQHGNQAESIKHPQNEQLCQNPKVSESLKRIFDKTSNAKKFDNGLPQWSPNEDYKAWKSTISSKESINSNPLSSTPSNPTTEFVSAFQKDFDFKHSPTNIHGTNQLFAYQVVENRQDVSQPTSISPNNVHYEEKSFPKHSKQDSGLNEKLPPDDTDKLSKLSLVGRLKLHREMIDNYGEPEVGHHRKLPKLISDNQGNSSEYKNAELEDSDDEVTKKRNTGVEVAPPCSMDYYSSSSSNRTKQFQGFSLNKRSMLSEMKESFKIGMSEGAQITKHLRNDLKKEASSDSDTE